MKTNRDGQQFHGIIYISYQEEFEDTKNRG